MEGTRAICNRNAPSVFGVAVDQEVDRRTEAKATNDGTSGSPSSWVLSAKKQSSARRAIHSDVSCPD